MRAVTASSALVSPLLLLAAWQATATAGLFPAQVLVPPSEVVATFRDLIATRELQAHLGESLFRLAIGFAAGAAAGLIFGIALALSKMMERLFGPLFQAVRQVPVIAFIPMLILIFGIEDLFKIVIVAKAAFFPVALATSDSIKGIPRRYFDVAAVYRLPLLPLVTRIVIPATVPPVLTGLRISLSRSWMVLVAAELLAADSGIGQMMEMGRQMFRIDVVMVGVLVTGLIGFALDRSLKLLERRLGRWRTR